MENRPKLIESLNKSTQSLLKSTNVTPIIIDLFPTNKESNDSKSVKDLEEKWNKVHPNNPCIAMTPGSTFYYDNIEENRKRSSVKNENEVFKIYVIGHSRPGSNILAGSSSVTDDDQQKINYKDLAGQLAFLIDNNGIKGRVVLNLIACGSGSGDDAALNEKESLSFAEKLQTELKKKYNMDIPIVARIPKVAIITEKGWQGTKETASLKQPFDTDEKNTIWLQKQANSKIIVASDQEGKQIKVDAYQIKQEFIEEQELFQVWREKVETQLEQAKNNTSSKSKREWLAEQINSFNVLPYEKISDIYFTLLDALNDEKSPIHKHSNPVSKLFKVSDTVDIVTQLLNAYPEPKPVRVSLLANQDQQSESTINFSRPTPIKKIEE